MDEEKLENPPDEPTKDLGFDEDEEGALLPEPYVDEPQLTSYVPSDEEEA